jgi:hypothetical protein
MWSNNVFVSFLIVMTKKKINLKHTKEFLGKNVPKSPHFEKRNCEITILDNYKSSIQSRNSNVLCFLLLFVTKFALFLFWMISTTPSSQN